MLLINCFSLAGFISDQPYWVKPFLASIGISCSNMSFSTFFVYSGELYPTFVRNIGIGSCSTFARVGSMIAPFIANIGSNSTWLPTCIFGTSMLVGALLCTALPETMNCKLPESLGDVRELQKRESLRGSLRFSLRKSIEIG